VKLYLDPTTGTARLEGLTLNKVDGLSQTLAQLQAEIEALQVTDSQAAISERLTAASQRVVALQQQLAAITPASIGAASSSQLTDIGQQISALQQQLTSLTPASIQAASSSELIATIQRVVTLQQQLAAITPASIGAASSTELEAANQRIAALQQQLANNMPDRQYILWGYGKAIRGSSSFLQIPSSVSQIYYMAYQNPAALNDEVEVAFPLRAGNYFLDIFGLRTVNNGIIQIYLNNSQLGGDIDKYNNSTIVFLSRFTVSIPTSGNQALRLKVVGKNAAAMNHINQISHILISPQV
jgi:uncharacterized small protein (DUF1192 family)